MGTLSACCCKTTPIHSYPLDTNKLAYYFLQEEIIVAASSAFNLWCDYLRFLGDDEIQTKKKLRKLVTQCVWTWSWCLSTASARKSKPLCAQQSLKTFLYYIEFSFSHPRSLQPGKRIVARCPKKCPTSTGCISETTLVLTAHFRVKRTTHGPIFNRVVEQKKRPTKTKLQNLPPPRCSVVITEAGLLASG